MPGEVAGCRSEIADKQEGRELQISKGPGASASKRDLKGDETGERRLGI